MNKALLIALSLALIPIASNADSRNYSCQKKLYNLEKQLSYAKQYGNEYRIKGLKRAIDKVSRNCYDHYSGATGATKLNRHYSDDTIRYLEEEIESLSQIIKDIQKNKFRLGAVYL
ncbi:DUF1090 family protein [Providencia burhodogranariea]|uniref:DUF1090 domain-containing protein n=1 Tax=Providencia burhodogranariea DSM 19968 TaxID=1141662 RepID=K8X5W5_9GAMM|nr:hypothetical protein OOA_00880 [Providencia burhodogranariea DSM 19968]